MLLIHSHFTQLCIMTGAIVDTTYRMYVITPTLLDRRKGERTFLTWDNSSGLRTVMLLDSWALCKTYICFTADVNRNEDNFTKHMHIRRTAEHVCTLTTCLPPGPKAHSWLLLELLGKRTKHKTIIIQVWHRYWTTHTNFTPTSPIRYELYLHPSDEL